MEINIDSAPSPCYLLDEKLIRRNLAIIKDVKDRAEIDIIVAFKGFAMWSAFDIVKEYINGATASSVYEAVLANEEMNTKAHTYAPAYSEADMTRLIDLSSHITFNSMSQLNKYLPQIQKSANDISVGIRINPEFSEVSTDLYNPCAKGTRLGMTAETTGDILPEGVDGVHFHTLCESDAEDLQKTLAAIEKRFPNTLKKAKWVNMGGGHLMTREGYNTELLIDTLIQFKERWDVDIILEPGSAFAWETGYLISTVLDIVSDNGINTAILDVSFTAHMPDCLEMPYKPEILSANSDNSGKYCYRMGGNSCLAGDYIGNWYFDNEIKPGDKIIFNDMIHYTMVKTTMFNGIDHPSIAIQDTNGGVRVVRKFSYSDYKIRLS
jgi:carboxynorspermidine decarboxylase